MAMKRLLPKCLVSFVLVFLIMNYCLLYAANVIPAKTTLPKFEMKTPANPELRTYLGIQDAKQFSLSDISAKLIIVEFFSVFCPVCHVQAPKANQLYSLIEGNQELKQDIKMIAIGLGNKPDQTDAYRKKFNVLFPVIPDPDESIIRNARIGRIPETVVVDKNGNVLARHSGVIDNLDNFLIALRKHIK